MKTYKKKIQRADTKLKKEYIPIINQDTGMTPQQIIDYFWWIIKHNAASKYQHQLQSYEIEDVIIDTTARVWKQVELGKVNIYSFQEIKSYLYRAFNTNLLKKLNDNKTYNDRYPSLDIQINSTQTYKDLLSDTISDDSSPFSNEVDEQANPKLKAIEMALKCFTEAEQKMILASHRETIAKQLDVPLNKIIRVRQTFRYKCIKFYQELTGTIPPKNQKINQAKTARIKRKENKINLYKKIKHLHEEGIPVLRLCRQYGISTTTVYKIINDELVDLIEKKPEIISKTQLELTLKQKIADLRQNGKNYKEISEELKCSKSTINYHLSTIGKEKSKLRNRKSKANKKWKEMTNTTQTQNKPIERDLYFSQTQICKIYKVSPKRLKQLLVQHKIEALNKEIDLGEYQVTALYITKEQIQGLGLELR